MARAGQPPIWRIMSIVTGYDDICAFCGKPAQATHHLVWGGYGALRDKADVDGLTIPVCDDCHNMGKGRLSTPSKKLGTMIVHGNSMAETMSKMIGQLAWEKQYYKERAGLNGHDDPSREAFMKRYGRSYL